MKKNTQTIKVVTLISNDPITGVKYGTIEILVPTVETKYAPRAYTNAQQIKQKFINACRTMQK